MKWRYHQLDIKEICETLGMSQAYPNTYNALASCYIIRDNRRTRKFFWIVNIWRKIKMRYNIWYTTSDRTRVSTFR